MMKHSHPWFGWNRYEQSLAWQKEVKNSSTGCNYSISEWEVAGKIYMKQPEGFVTKGQEHLVCLQT